MSAEDDLIARYRVAGECDDCAAAAAALATGYDPVWGGGCDEPCVNEGCRWFDADYAAALAALDVPPPRRSTQRSSTRTGSGGGVMSEPNGPSEIPHCAGRVAVAHERTAMRQVAAGWECPVCGETDADWWADIDPDDLWLGECGCVHLLAPGCPCDPIMAWDDDGPLVNHRCDHTEERVIVHGR